MTDDQKLKIIALTTGTIIWLSALILIFLGIRSIFRSLNKSINTAENDQSNLLQNLIFVEKEEYEKGFSQYFEQIIKSKLQPLENLRIETIQFIKKNRPKFYFSIPIILIISIAIGFIIDGNIGMWIFFWLLFVSFSVIYGNPQNRYKGSVKKTILPLICDFYGNFKYNINGVIDYKLLEQSLLFNNFNNHKSEDYITGIYNDVNIELCEIDLRKQQGNDYNQIFKGLVVLMNMNKPFIGNTIVINDKNETNKVKNNLNSISQVFLEDIKFEKIFDIYSTDQIEARYLLTTAFMERFIKLTDCFNCKNIQCSFFDKYLLITLPIEKNLFEPQNISKSIINTDDIHKFLKQMHNLFEIIDILKLNLKIGL